MSLNIFVIMPFDPEFDSLYQKLLKEPLEDVGYRVNRADDLEKNQNILREIIIGIKEADLVICDMTTMNPNVFYELGIAHTQGKPVILLAQDLNEIPFDLRPYNVITYSTNFDVAFELPDKVKNLCSKFIEGTYNFANPVIDFQIVNQSEGIRNVNIGMAMVETEAEATEHMEDYGILDHLTDAYESMVTLGELASNLTQEQNWLNQRFVYHTAEVDKINSSPPSGRQLVQRNKVSKEMANDINNFVKELETTVPQMNDAWSRMSRGLENYLSSVQIANENDVEALEKFYSQMLTFKETTSTTSLQLAEFPKSVGAIRKISKELNRAGVRLESNYQELIDGFEIGEASVARVLEIILELIENYKRKQNDEDNHAS